MGAFHAKYQFTSALGSATLVAATSSVRQRIKSITISVMTFTGSGVATVHETNSTGSNSAILAGVTASQSGMHQFKWDDGTPASATGSRIVANVDAGSSTVVIQVDGDTL